MKHPSRPFALAAAGMLALLLAAQPAQAHHHDNDDEPSYAPALPAPPPPPPANGAIFQASMGYAPLTSGARPARVGDLITIVLVEKTQAQKTNSASTARNGSLGFSMPTTGPLSFISSSDTQMGSTDGFKGAGAAEQSNQLTGALTVTISKVYPNGTFEIRGEKQLTLSRGEETIQISGLIRAADIQADNSILSTRVANAVITYTGKGEIARANKQGWLGRFFSRISPF